MKPWIRKIALIAVTISTLGMYTPTALLEVQADDSKDNFSSKMGQNIPNTELAAETMQVIQEPAAPTLDEHLGLLAAQAKEKALTKFGPRISGSIEQEFTDLILPQIESVLGSILNESGERYTYYSIAEEPAGGYGERIFNVYDELGKKNIAKFHVRRDNRPLEGYYFNFHYHLSSDGFKEHHQIGDIYWNKNMPPKWMA